MRLKRDHPLALGRQSLAVGGAVFAFGALGCSIAPAMGELLLARLLQGVGGGLILAGSMAFISVLYEPQLRTYAVAVTNATWIVAAIVVKKLGFKFTLTMASYNLIRLPKLIEATA